MIRFEQPWVFLLLLFFPLVVLLLRAHPRPAAARRAAAWLCLGVALAGPEVLWGRAPQPIVLALDLSASAWQSSDRAAARAQSLLREMPRGVPVGIVAFAEKGHMVSPPDASGGPAGTLISLERLLTDPGAMVPTGEREGTDIAAGLELAAWALPQGSRGGTVVLVSDGWQTRGDARRAAHDLTRRGIAVDVLAVDRGSRDLVDAAVEDLEAPGQVPQSLPFEIRASVRSTAEGDATVSLLQDGAPVSHQKIRLSPGDNPVRFQVIASGPGERRQGIRVALHGDQESRNDAAETAVAVLGRPSILWIGQRRGGASAMLPAALHGSGMEVVRSAPDSLAGPLGRLGDFDAVVLADVEAAALPSRLPELLRDHVGRLGGGLLMLGGARSFGPGGYHRTPIEDVLPVDLDPGSRRKRPGLALVLALDKSGSMAERLGAQTKMTAAREAATVAAALLEAGDRFGLVAFDGAPTPLLAVQDVPSGEQLALVLAPVRPGGGTRILPALDQAAGMLKSLEGFRRHIVLVTDGRGEGGDFSAYARRLEAAGITVSAVAVGDDADVPLLQALAAGGGGRFEHAGDAARLGAALRREVVLARGPVVQEGPTAIVARPHRVLEELANDRIPPLFGYISTAPKPFAAVPLSSESGDPILALGSFGLGRTAALTTDLDGPWGAEWRRWPGSERMLTAVLRWLLRAPVAGSVAIAEEQARGGFLLMVRAEDPDGNRLNARSLVAHLAAAGAEEAVVLEQRGPGTYGASLRARAVRPTRVTLEDRTEGASRLAGQGWIGLHYPDEYRIRGPNRELLDEIREASGGRWLDASAGGPPLRWTEPRRLTLWPWLTCLALGLFLLDLALRRGLWRLPARGKWRGRPAGT